MLKDFKPTYARPASDTQAGFVSAAVENLRRWISGHRDLAYIPEAILLLEVAKEKPDGIAG